MIENGTVGGSGNLGSLFGGGTSTGSGAVGYDGTTGSGTSSGSQSGGFNFGSLIGPGIGALGQLFSAKKTSDAQTDSAGITATALTNAATIQSKANDATLAYEQKQADQTQANFGTTQKANYDQWAARQQRLSAYGQLFGAPAQDIPAYVPPTTLGSYATAPPSGPTPAGSTGSNPSDPTSGDAITAQLTANYKALGLTPTGPGSGPTDIAYYAQKVKETGGLTPQNSAYWFGPTGRIATDAAKASGGSAAATTPTAPPLTSLGAGLQAPMAPPITGNLVMPTVGSLASYFPGAR